MINRSIRLFTYAWIITVALIVVSGWTPKASAGVAIPVEWDNSTEGTFARSTVELFNISGPSLVTRDLSGPDYAAAPLSPDTVIVSYDVLSDWTATFDPPVENLLLYLLGWRGVAGGPDPVTYQFDQPFTVLSGLGGVTVSNGNTVLSIPGSIFADGIIQFAGPVSSLSILTDGDNNSAQDLTFGVLSSDIPPTNIPTLSEWGLMAMAAVLGIIGLMVIRRRKATA